MSRIAIATLQSGWDCRWGHQDDTPVQAHTLDNAGPSLLCTRQGAPRRVSSRRCETCPHWQLADEAFQPRAADGPWH